MSDTDKHPSESHYVVRTEEDTARARPMIYTGVVVLLVFAVGVYLVRLVQNFDEEALGGVSTQVPKEVRQYEVGIVNQVQFAADRRSEQSAADARARLASYGWVDRQKQIIHLPVEKVMQQMVSEGGGQ